MWLPLLMSSLVVVDSTNKCNSTYSVSGRYLKGHVISSENVKNIGMCYVSCLRDGHCKSINFHFGDLLCELNDANRHTHPWDYELKKDHTYSDYPVKVCDSIFVCLFVCFVLFCFCSCFFFTFCITWGKRNHHTEDLTGRGEDFHS